MNLSSRPLRVLLVEDSDNDAALLELALQKAGFQPKCERVETSKGLAKALAGHAWDLIIADYVLPAFDGLSALAQVKQHGLDLPVIIVSGHITDDTAVAAMKAGAHDYVMKDNLARLGPAVERELRDAEVRRARRQTERKLWEEHAFRQAIELSVPSGIAVVDLDGTQTYVNPAFCHMVGWTEAELLGAKAPLLYWPPEEVETIAAAFADIVGKQNLSGRLELRFRRRDETRFSALVLLTALRDHFDNVSGWLSSITDITQLKNAEAELRRSHEELEVRVQQRTAALSAANAQLQAAMAERRRLEHELLEITEKERRRIGLDLHDDLGQKLSGVALMAKGLQVKLARQRSPDAKEARQIHALIQQAMSHTSDVAHDLATLEVQEKDLPSALSDLAARAKVSFRVSCRLKVEGKIPPLEPPVVRQLYKIAQEALTNAIKHGKARQIQIALANSNRQIRLTVRNDGVPFPSAVGRDAGMGLRIMNYRAHIIGGSVQVKPGRPAGTVVSCTVPMGEKK